MQQTVSRFINVVRLPKQTRSLIYKRFVLGGLSSLCFYACYWQTQRHRASKQKWDKALSALKNWAPIPIEGVEAKNFPWECNSDNWEYKLVELKGYFKDERFFVRRTKDGRLGYLVFAPFVTAISKSDNIKREQPVNSPVENSIFVNLGWVPLEHKKDIELGNEPIPMLKRDLDDFNDPDQYTGLTLYDESQEEPHPVTKITGIVRKGEEQDILNKKRNWPYEGVYSYVDLHFMRRFFRVFNISSTEAYIERMVPNFADDQEELYPVPSTMQNFDKPYLTPERHRDYASFWFLSGFAGLVSMKFVKK